MNKWIKNLMFLDLERVPAQIAQLFVPLYSRLIQKVFRLLKLTFNNSKLA